MGDYFAKLAARSLGQAATLRPRVPGVYEPPRAMGGAWPGSLERPEEGSAEIPERQESRGNLKQDLEVSTAVERSERSVARRNQEFRQAAMPTPGPPEVTEMSATIPEAPRIHKEQGEAVMEKPVLRVEEPVSPEEDTESARERQRENGKPPSERIEAREERGEAHFPKKRNWLEEGEAPVESIAIAAPAKPPAVKVFRQFSGERRAKQVEAARAESHDAAVKTKKGAEKEPPHGTRVAAGQVDGQISKLAEPKPRQREERAVEELSRKARTVASEIELPERPMQAVAQTHHAPRAVFPRFAQVRRNEQREPRAAEETTQTPTVQVTIGRIEIRATAAPAAKTGNENAAPKIMGLREYLQRRAGGNRR